MNDINFFPNDGTYIPHPGVFATWLGAPGDIPNPCRKYHVSAAKESAEVVAAVVLPELREMKLHHKVVATYSKLLRMQLGKQAGKFITVYAPLAFDQSKFVDRLSVALSKFPELQPSPTVPKSRQYKHIFVERPLDEGLFVYGGYEIDPSK